MGEYLLTRVRCMVKSRKGQGMTEYALVLGLVVALGVAVLTTDNTLKNGIIGAFTNVSTKLGSAAGS